jgi:hypothetical protein
MSTGRRLSPAALLLILGLAGGCGGDDQQGPTIRHPEDFLPRDVSGWSQGAVETATTADELNGIINGEYWVYEQHNFQEFAWSQYDGSAGGSAATLEAWIFEMQTPADAYATYHDTEHGIEPTSAEPTEQVFGEESRIYGQFGVRVLDFISGPYWVKLTLMHSATQDDASSILHVFAASVEQRMPE